MNISKNQQDLIDAYLSDELTDEMRQRFETMLATDKVLQEEFIFQQSLAETAALDSVKKAMKQARTENLPDNKCAYSEFKMVQNSIKAAKTKNVKRQRRHKIRRLLIQAAVAACILLTGSWILWANGLKKDTEKALLAVFNETDLQGLNTQDIGKDYALEGHNDTKLRSVSASPSALDTVTNTADRELIIKSKLKEIETAYREKHFDEALEILNDLQNQLASGSSLQSTFSYYKANLYAQTADYPQSIKTLRRLTRKKSDIQDDAHWLLGLLYLKTNEKAKAKKQFKILVETSKQYKDKARQKLKKHYIL